MHQTEDNKKSLNVSDLYDMNQDERSLLSHSDCKHIINASTCAYIDAHSFAYCLDILFQDNEISAFMMPILMKNSFNEIKYLKQLVAEKIAPKYTYSLYSFTAFSKIIESHIGLRVVRLDGIYSITTQDILDLCDSLKQNQSIVSFKIQTIGMQNGSNMQSIFRSIASMLTVNNSMKHIMLCFYTSSITAHYDSSLTIPLFENALNRLESKIQSMDILYKLYSDTHASTQNIYGISLIESGVVERS